MGFLSGVVGAVGGIASTLLGNNSAKHEAERNRDFQEEMSNTAISRRMQDLRNAGLNPLLAVDNASAGASTPAGSQAQLQQINPQWITALSSAMLQRKQSEVAQAEERKVNAEAQAQEQENSIFSVKADKLKLEAELQRQGILTQQTMQDLNKANSLEAKARILVHQAQRNNINMSTEEAKRKVQLLDIGIEPYLNHPNLKYDEIFSNINSSPARIVSSLGNNSSNLLLDIYDLVTGGFNSARNLIDNVPKKEQNIKYRGYRN